MSQYDPTLSVLGIPDHNIKVAFVRHEYRGNGVRRRQYHVIDAELTYRLTRCPLCGFEALHPNGFYTAGKNVNGPDKNCPVLPNAYGCHLNSRIIRSFISV